ncbi:MAG: hypothetical protein M8354_06840 [Halalkalicoccus sp.]|nr:hypothetical protein [Halalkalicoccus sp.]
MTLDTRNEPERLPSVGVDAVSLARYSDVGTDDDELIVYDEKREDAWIQSDRWCAAAEMV